jgi:hypothetical protein
MPCQLQPAIGFHPDGGQGPGRREPARRLSSRLAMFSDKSGRVRQFRAAFQPSGWDVMESRLTPEG